MIFRYVTISYEDQVVSRRPPAPPHSVHIIEPNPLQSLHVCQPGVVLPDPPQLIHVFLPPLQNVHFFQTCLLDMTLDLLVNGLVLQSIARET